MSKKIAIIGAGGHGKVVGEIALLNKFKVVTFYDSENSYIGPGLSLWISQDLFPMQLRGTFRSSLYGFYLENNIDLGRAPIEFKETIRFEEFLEGPIKIA